MADEQRSLLDAEVLRDVLARVANSDVDELEIAQGSARLYFRRRPGARPAAPTAQPPASAGEGTAVRAPLAGVLYSRPSPELPPFVSVGDLVENGQVVALIETMKLFNEVTVDFAGEVISLAVADGDLVEAGQPLLYLRPRESGGA